MTERRSAMVDPNTSGGDCVFKQYTPTPSTKVFLEDMSLAICHSDNCEYRNDPCNHKRLSIELLKAMLDYYSDVLDKNNQSTAANLLRSEL